MEFMYSMKRNMQNISDDRLHGKPDKSASAEIVKLFHNVVSLNI